MYNDTRRKEKRRILRKQQTSAESLLWLRLRKRQLGVTFHRQYSIGPYFLDFYSPEKRLAIELDGSQHNDPDSIEYDRYRTQFLNRLDIHVIRFWNRQVLTSMNDVLEEIYRLL